MKKRNYLFALALLSMGALSVSAQDAVIENDLLVVEPGAWGDFATAKDIAVTDGVTITFTKDVFNSCAFLMDAKLTMLDDTKIVMFDSPDLWMADLDDPENADFIDDMPVVDGEFIDYMPYNFEIDGNVTIDADSKCKIGGKYTGTGTLTLCVGDSTVLCADFSEFAGTLKIQKKTDTASFILGRGFPGQHPDHEKAFTSNANYASMSWVLEIPDGLVITTNTVMALALPRIVGAGHIKNDGHSVMLRPNETASFDCTIEGDGTGEQRYLEYFSTGPVVTTFTKVVDFATNMLFVRCTDHGILVNSDPSKATFANITGAISIRGHGGFVGGTGYIGCALEGKPDFRGHIKPGAAGDNSIGVLTVARDVSLFSYNFLDIDFGGNGDSDVLVCESSANFDGTICFAPYLTEEFYANPKAGDYRVVKAATYTPNVALDEATQEEVVTNTLRLESSQLTDEKPTIHDLLPEGYTWNFDKFFTEGIVSILGPGYVEGVIVNDHMTGIEADSMDEQELVSRQYFSINGVRLAAPEAGITIVRSVYSNGSVKVTKVFNKAY